MAILIVAVVAEGSVVVVAVRTELPLMSVTMPPQSEKYAVRF